MSFYGMKDNDETEAEKIHTSADEKDEESLGKPETHKVHEWKMEENEMEKEMDEDKEDLRNNKEKETIEETFHSETVKETFHSETEPFHSETVKEIFHTETVKKTSLSDPDIDSQADGFHFKDRRDPDTTGYRHTWKYSRDAGTTDVVEPEVEIEKPEIKLSDPSSSIEKHEDLDDWKKSSRYEKEETEEGKEGKRDDVSDGKGEKHDKKVLKETNGVDKITKSYSKGVTPAAPKKVADKVSSILEDYAIKVKNASGEDKTPKKGTSIKRSDSDATKGHISEIRERIERSASSTTPSRTPKGSGTGGGSNVPLEEKRKKKAEEWMNKVGKPSADGSVQAPSERSTPVSPPGKGQTSAWRKRELELKKEREEKEAAQKLQEEKRKKLEQERRLAREAARKEKEQQEQLMKKDQQPVQRSSADERKQISHHKDVDKFSRPVHSTSAKPSPLVKSLSTTGEDEKAKKQKALESRIKPLDIEGLDADGLEKKVHELYERIKTLEEDKYDLEILLEKRDLELNELKVRTGDAKGKFIKPPLKKLIKTDEGSVTGKPNGELSYREKLKAEDVESRNITITSEEDQDQVQVGIGSDLSDETHHLNQVETQHDYS